MMLYSPCPGYFSYLSSSSFVHLERRYISHAYSPCNIADRKRCQGINSPPHTAPALALPHSFHHHHQPHHLRRRKTHTRHHPPHAHPHISMYILISRASDANLCPSNDSSCLGPNASPNAPDSSPVSSDTRSLKLSNLIGIIMVFALLLITLILWFSCRRWPNRPEWCCGRARKPRSGADDAASDADTEKGKSARSSEETLKEESEKRRTTRGDKKKKKAKADTHSATTTTITLTPDALREHPHDNDAKEPPH
ncbi:hypothetical protein PLICRDRAFT_383771 [Plicaturopsis crispa FD-325 SS-3]|nr:hypothetical protein PLICRDRAFT_383771 [Plicaturopsis crispa FD-325 SS-3]